MNLGLRFEVEQGMTETADRMITSFDPDFVPAFAEEVIAAYARSPIPEVSVAAFRENLHGGAVYAGENGQSRRGWKSQVMWLPRASAAYQVNDGMVVKGGYGVYYDSLNATAITPNQLGFSTVTTIPSSNDFGQTWTSGNPRAGTSPLVDPFPVRADGTRFSTPAGSSLGGDFVAGQALNYGNLDREHARLQRWRAGVQRELGRNMAIEVAYVGTYSDDVDVSSFLGNTNNTQASVRQDILPAQYLEPHEHAERGSSDREQPKHHEPVLPRQPDGAAGIESRAVQSAGCASLVHEPDDPEEPAVAAISSHERGERSPGTGVAARQGSHARRRSGVPAEVLSGSQPQRGVLGHPGRGVAERHQRIRRRANTVDYLQNARPHRVTLNGVWELPFGRGRAFLNNGGFWSKILGGWQTGQTFEWQPGPLLQYGNVFFYGDVDSIALDDPTLNEWFDTDAGFERNAMSVPADFQERLFPLRVDGLRGDQTLLLNSSISRTFPLMGRSNLQIRLDAANMLNRQQFANPQLNPTADRFRSRDGECEHGAAVPDSDVEADVLMCLAGRSGGSGGEGGRARNLCFGAGREPDRGSHGCGIVFGGVMGHYRQGGARQVTGEVGRGKCGIAACGRFENRLVLVCRDRKGARHAFDVQPPVPIRVVVKLADRAHQAVASVCEQRKVKFAVDALPLAKVVTGERFHAAQTAAQRVDIALGEARDINADRQRLVNDPHGIQLLEVVDGKRGHAPAAVHFGLDEAFALQHAHGFAEGPTADAELAGQLNLGQRFAGWQRSVEDRFAEAAVDGPRHVARLTRAGAQHRGRCRRQWLGFGRKKLAAALVGAVARLGHGCREYNIAYRRTPVRYSVNTFVTVCPEIEARERKKPGKYRLSVDTMAYTPYARRSLSRRRADREARTGQ